MKAERIENDCLQHEDVLQTAIFLFCFFLVYAKCDSPFLVWGFKSGILRGSIQAVFQLHEPFGDGGRCDRAQADRFMVAIVEVQKIIGI